MNFVAQPLVRRKRNLRMALCGPAGSGKTWDALMIALEVVPAPGRILLIESERSSAECYAELFNEDGRIDVIQLPDHSPTTYTAAVRWAETKGYGGSVIDSLSHAWIGKEGALEQVDKKSGGKGSFDAWRHVTPQHSEMVDALLSFNGHLIATMRVKTEYVIETKGKNISSVSKVGLAPVQRDGLEYEFDIVGDVQDQTVSIGKTRCIPLLGYSVHKPDFRLGQTIREWCDAGTDEPAKPSVAAPSRANPQPAQTSAAPLKGPEAAYLEDMLGLDIDARNSIKVRCRDASLDWRKLVRELMARIEGELVDAPDLFGSVDHVWNAIAPESLWVEIKEEPEPVAPAEAASDPALVQPETPTREKAERPLSDLVKSPQGMPSAEELIEQGRNPKEYCEAAEGTEAFGYKPVLFPIPETYRRDPAEFHIQRVAQAANERGLHADALAKGCELVAAAYQLRPRSAAAFIAFYDFLQSAPNDSLERLSEAASEALAAPAKG